MTRNSNRAGWPSRAKNPGSGRVATGLKTISRPAKSRGRPRLAPAVTQARRQQILVAALAVFAQHGFEAARLDEIAKRAKVAKGTLYLYFPDKQAMFEALVRSAAEPIVAGLSALAERRDLPMRSLLDHMFALFREQVLGTRRKLVIRLLIAEGPRFPEIAAFYHREVLSRVMGLLKAMAQRAHASGELDSDVLVRFPQLVAAPLLLSVIWDGLFHRLDPLDVEGLLAAHAGLLTAKRRPRR